MKEENPRRFEIEGNGNWGICEGTVFYRWEVLNFDINTLIKTGKYLTCIGLDYGFTNDPTALIVSLVNEDEKEIYIIDEHYQTGMFNEDIVELIKYKGYSKSVIVADSAEEKSIKWMKKNGVPRIKSSVKGPDSIMFGIQYLQGYKVYIHPKCKNFIIEIKNYVWDTDKKTGKSLNKPIDNYNHLIDAWRYSIEPLLIRNNVNKDNFKFITNKK